LTHAPASRLILSPAYENPLYLFALVSLLISPALAEVKTFSVRASEINPEAKEYPEIDFVFEKGGKPQDMQYAAVDPEVKPRGELVIWMMSYRSDLFDRLAGYGFHAIQPHYANRWFSKVCLDKPVSETCRGDVRLEAATGQDFSDEVNLAEPDGMMARALNMLLWLDEEDPKGKWDQFLTKDKKGILWDKVVMSGASHGSTTSARFAKHQKVNRVVMLCGPRDQYQTWQALDSATPANRYFGFSHVLDGGWTADHYCRSWELLGLHEFGPIINVDEAKPPYGNSRRLISAADVGGDAKKAHSAVTPGGASPKDDSGIMLYESVWRYIYTHPVEEVGEPVDQDPGCEKDQQQ